MVHELEFGHWTSETQVDVDKSCSLRSSLTAEFSAQFVEGAVHECGLSDAAITGNQEGATVGEK